MSCKSLTLLFGYIAMYRGDLHSIIKTIAWRMVRGNVALKSIKRVQNIPSKSERQNLECNHTAQKHPYEPFSIHSHAIRHTSWYSKNIIDKSAYMSLFFRVCSFVLRHLNANSKFARNMQSHTNRNDTQYANMMVQNNNNQPKKKKRENKK